MKGAPVFLLALAACAAGGGNVEPPLDPAELPALVDVPALLRPAAADYRRDGALLRGARAYERGDVEQAAAQLQAARVLPDAAPEVCALHVWVLLEASTPQAAQWVAEEGLVRWPTAAAPRAALVEVLLRRDLGADAARMLEPLAARGERDPYVIALQARTAFALRDWAATLHQLDRLAAAGPLDDRMLRMRARALEGAGRPQDAIPLYERLAADADVDPVLLEEMAFAALRAARSTGNVPLYARAEALLQRVTALDPQHGRAHAGIAECAAARGAAAVAQGAWRRALEVDPADVDSGLALASSLVAAGAADEAARLLRDLLRQPLGQEDARRVAAALAAAEAPAEPASVPAEAPATGGGGR